jgi:flagellar biosynthesis/type III secretory pathway protein FliH
MKAEKTVYRVSPSYEEYIRKMDEQKNSMDRAQAELEIREAGIAEGIEIGIEQGIEKGMNKKQQFILDLLDQGLTSEELRKRLLTVTS